MYQLVDDENDNDELLEAVDDYEQRDSVYPPYSDGAVEEADPDRSSHHQTSHEAGPAETILHGWTSPPHHWGLQKTSPSPQTSSRC